MSKNKEASDTQKSNRSLFSVFSVTPIVAPEGEPGLFHSDNIFEAYFIGEIYGYVVLFVVVVVLLVLVALSAKVVQFYRYCRDKMKGIR